MGANASNEIQAAASESLNILNSQTQDCITTISQTEAIQVCTNNKTLCPGGANYNISNNNFTEATQYTTNCTANVNVTTQVQSQINQSFSQAATAIAQQFQLSAANTNNVANIASNIATNISTVTVQNCTQQAAQSQGIQIGCNPDSGGICNVTITGNTFVEQTNAISDCILQDTNVQLVIDSITQVVTQTGTAKVESLLGPIIALILIVLLIFGAVFFGGTKIIGDWRLWVVVIVVVLIYLALAFWRKWFPFD